MIKEVSIQAVKDQAQIEDVVGQFLKLDKAGSKWRACCPFHKEKTPSFVVTPSMNIYKCFGCGAAGDPVKFLMEHERLDFISAIKWLADYYSITLEETKEKEDPKVRDHMKELRQVLRAAERFYQRNLFKMLDKEGETPAKYLLEWRKWTKDTILTFGLGYAPDEWKALFTTVKEAGVSIPAKELGLIRTSKGNTYDLFRHRIIFPIHDHKGQVVGFGARTLSEDYKAEKIAKYLNSSDSKAYNKSRVLYGLHQAIVAKAFHKQRKAYLVEGYADVISWHQAGLTNTVATCGTSLTDEGARLLHRFATHVVIVRDGDSAGTDASLRDIDILLNHSFKVEVARLPEEMDPDDFIQEHPIEELEVMDAVDFKADCLMAEADDPDQLQKGAVGIARMLAAIPENFKREGYVNRVVDSHKKLLKKGQLNKMIKDLSARHLKEGEKIEVQDPLPDGLSKEEKENYLDYSFYEYEGRFFSVGSNGQPYDVTNFTMEILYHVETSEDTAYRLIKVKNVFGRERVIQMNTDDFVSVGAFRKVVAKRGNFIFKGNDVDLHRLQEKLQRGECTTKRVDILGYHKRFNFYVFANGIIDCNLDFDDPSNSFKPIDDYGIVKHDDMNLFIPAMSKINEENEDEYTNDRKFKFMQSKVTFKEWASQYHTVHGDKGKIGMAFYIAALFRDIIKDTLDNRFPLLNLYGIYESGKTSFAESILYMWGEPQSPLELGGASTPIGYARSMAQFSNALVLLDEYSNSLNKKYIDFLKGIYQGTGYTRGRKDNSVRTDNIINRSAAILAGQEMPTWDQALFTRVIMLVFNEKIFSEKEKEEFDKLSDMQRQGLSHITARLLKYRKQFREQYKGIYHRHYKKIKEMANEETISSRMYMNYACLSAAMELIGQYEEVPFSTEDIQQVIVHNMLNQHRVMAGSDDVQKFWDVVEDLFKAGTISEGNHFELSRGELWISLKSVFGLYEKEMRQRGSSNVIDKSTLRNYLQIDPDVYLGDDRKVFSNGEYIRCMRFRYDALDINLIRIAEEQARKEKYREMNIDIPEEDNKRPLDKQHAKDNSGNDNEDNRQAVSEEGEDLPF